DAYRFGVVEYDHKQPDQKIPVQIHEKPQFPPSNDIVTGLYAYPKDVFKYIFPFSKSIFLNVIPSKVKIEKSVISTANFGVFTKVS
ncbi:MAG: hypothetical protein KKB19_03700, partial [Bacteroidetes bacterium]|nr:hypothetical protein [Bacteroidota bacterium]